ncbi:50S ribosomal protein L21 [Proteiniborus sp. MB09-C3]|uniref:50S ribosomal protein L21 n=1 Tax=Proteiniborus sp. MB09-C3 TaxID=3050072 RepID=UPI0025540F7C|nr:50S ribosomal protein L21 [Proteiniborus sp. MB09-C3]WIV10610.1 50S ribosomal protein L21 [Proteiniborus sp. MB09-C3]
MYAVVETGGKQYRVQEGDVVFIEKVDGNEGESLNFDKILLVSNGEEVKVGKPYVDGVSVTGNIVEHGKAKKVVVFKFKRKKDFRKKQGHRQPYTKVKIEKING